MRIQIFRKKSLLWQLYPSFLLITFFSVVAIIWYASTHLHRIYLDTVKTDLTARARLIQNLVLKEKLLTKEASLDELCKSLGNLLSFRITVMLTDGRVIGESHEDPETMENHRDRPEMREALKGTIGTSMRYSTTLQRQMMYVAVPLLDRQKIVGVIRTSLPLTTIEQVSRTIYAEIALGGFVVAAIAALVSWIISSRISRPLERLRHGAERFARGDFDARLAVPDSEPIGSLAETLNNMAAQLDDRIRTIVRQRNQQEAILLSMIEGVIAVDHEQRILSMNHAAKDCLDVQRERFEGRNIVEVIRNADLHQFISMTLSSPVPLEDEIVLGENNERFLQVHGTALRDAEGNQIGCVIVLNDVTRLRRLESIRHEFVANVSHELKTPITSIKGFVETLMDGALHDAEDAMRFLGIVSKQADRLHAIIEDLLNLSRIEQEEKKEHIALDRLCVCETLHCAVECCRQKAEEKDIECVVECGPDITADINPPLLEQALVNLIDNAVKYSDSGGEIRVKATEENQWVLILVQDRGCGIPHESLPRLFERFYRVDKARSRKLGGTGLGLAIVKHISQAHRGYVSVESEYGVGSVFTIHLPKTRSTEFGMSRLDGGTSSGELDEPTSSEAKQRNSEDDPTFGSEPSHSSG